MNHKNILHSQAMELMISAKKVLKSEQDVLNLSNRLLDLLCEFGDVAQQTPELAKDLDKFTSRAVLILQDLNVEINRTGIHYNDTAREAFKLFENE